jgi:ribosome-binding protein aMBF1 (putative translation factor)
MFTFKDVLGSMRQQPTARMTCMVCSRKDGETVKMITGQYPKAKVLDFTNRTYLDGYMIPDILRHLREIDSNMAGHEATLIVNFGEKINDSYGQLNWQLTELALKVQGKQSCIKRLFVVAESLNGVSIHTAMRYVAFDDNNT